MTEEVILGPVTVGDTKGYNFTFTTDTGMRKDITGWTVYFTVKHRTSDSDDDALLTKDVSSHDKPTEGETSFVLSSTETAVEPGVYVYDMQVKRDTNTVTTFMKGTIEFTEEVTQRDD
jgi:hypothetical protein